MIPLVFVPGMMCDGRLFGPQIEALSANSTIELATISAHDTIEALSADVLAKTPPLFALCGLSMGGIVAIEMIEQAPERIAGLALLDTNPRAETEDISARREPQIQKVLGGGLLAVMRDEMKPNYLADGPDRGRILDLCMDMALDLGPEVFVRQSKALQTRSDRQATLASADLPTLIAYGEDDRLCPVERHELMHRLVAGSRMEVITGAGHLPTLEQPERTNDLLRRWLEQVNDKLEQRHAIRPPRP